MREREMRYPVVVEGRDEHSYIPDYAVSNCWVSCECEFGKHIEIVFDIHDTNTGVTFKNVKGQLQDGCVQFSFNLGEGPPRDIRDGETQTSVAVESRPDEDFQEAIAIQVLEWCKTLLVAAENQAVSIPDLDEFRSEFNGEDEDGESDETASDTSNSTTHD